VWSKEYRVLYLSIYLPVHDSLRVHVADPAEHVPEVGPDPLLREGGGVPLLAQQRAALHVLLGGGRERERDRERVSET
jgi:hypothetical protein